jgi:DNA-binding transcriptional MerR regulator
MSAKLNVDIVAQLKEFNKAMTELKSEVDGISKNVAKSSDETTKSTKKMSGAFSDVGKTIASVFAVDQLINFGKKIVDTTVEFQKMEAVLSTALGSNSAAKAAMDQIVDFASSTPFQVNELTDAFVKLSNMGFVPTMEQMRSMGDLASSVGKSFDQLAEAVIDAQTGEFERLKEFGIRASQQGDIVQFTFKGITTEVAKSDKAIQEYLLSLGNLEGVAGSMEAISKTTGGTISNLGDNVTQLFKNIGDSSSGFINRSIKALNNLVSTFRYFSEFMELKNPFKTLSETSDEAREFLLRVRDANDDLRVSIKDVASKYDSLSVSTLTAGQAQTKFLNEMIRLGYSVEDSKALFQTYVKLRKEQASSEEMLANSTSKTTAATQQNTAETERQAAARQKAHEQRIKQLRKEAEEFLKNQDATLKKVGSRDAFGGQPTDVSKQVTPERLAMIQNASSSILAMNKQIAATMPGIIIPEDAIERLNLAAAAQSQMAYETQLVAQNMNAALMVGDMFGQALGQLAETGKISFQGIFDALKQMVLRFAAAIAAAITLNILTGGAVMSAGKAAGAKSGFGALLKGGSSLGIGGLTPFANGGIVSGPTPALVGEYTGARTNPEVIAPLSKLQNMMGGNVTFTISGDNLVGTLNRANKTRARKF